MRSCETSLIVGRAGKVGKTNDIAHCVDMRLSALVGLIDFDIATMIRLNSQCFETHTFRISSAPVGPQQHVRLDHLAGFQMQDDTIIVNFNAFVFLVLTNHHPLLITHVITQSAADLVIKVLEQTFTSIDQVDLDPDILER